MKSLIRKLTYCCEKELLENHLIRDWEHFSAHRDLFMHTNTVTDLFVLCQHLFNMMHVYAKVFTIPHDTNVNLMDVQEKKSEGPQIHPIGTINGENVRVSACKQWINQMT